MGGNQFASIAYLHGNDNDLVKREKLVQETRIVLRAESLSMKNKVRSSAEIICLAFDRSKDNLLKQEGKQNKW